MNLIQAKRPGVMAREAVPWVQRKFVDKISDDLFVMYYVRRGTTEGAPLISVITMLDQAVGEESFLVTGDVDALNI